MRCHLGTSCEATATQKLTINDWRTGFVQKTVDACAKCVADQPALLAEHESWEKRQPKKK